MKIYSYLRVSGKGQIKGDGGFSNPAQGGHGGGRVLSFSQLAQIAGLLAATNFLGWKNLSSRWAKTVKGRDIASFDPDPRHVARDKRTRKSTGESGIQALA